MGRARGQVTPLRSGIFGGNMGAKLSIAFLAAGIAGLATAWPQNNPPPSQQQSTAPPAGPKEPAPPPSVTVIGARDAHGVLGRDVRSTTDEDMGRIVDVIVDRSGTVRAAVIDFGGFLGVGSRKNVVGRKAPHFGSVDHKSDR